MCVFHKMLWKNPDFLANLIHMCIDTHRPSCWLSGKESACDVGHAGSIPGWGRCPGEGNGNPLQDSCLGNPVDGGACLATVHGVRRVGQNLTNPLPPYMCVCVCVPFLHLWFVSFHCCLVCVRGLLTEALHPWGDAVKWHMMPRIPYLSLGQVALGVRALLNCCAGSFSVGYKRQKPYAS